eukprot:355620-Chlamydomonas_euryale.AAC.4
MGSVKVDVRLSTLKPLLPLFLGGAWSALVANPELIRSGQDRNSGVLQHRDASEGVPDARSGHCVPRARESGPESLCAPSQRVGAR